jgi:hypothetical protein
MVRDAVFLLELQANMLSYRNWNGLNRTILVCISDFPAFGSALTPLMCSWLQRLSSVFPRKRTISFDLAILPLQALIALIVHLFYAHRVYCGQCYLAGACHLLIHSLSRRTKSLACFAYRKSVYLWAQTIAKIGLQVLLSLAQSGMPPTVT